MRRWLNMKPTLGHAIWGKKDTDFLHIHDIDHVVRLLRHAVVTVDV